MSSQFFGLTVARVQITRGVSDFLEGRSVYARETFLRCRANDEALEASEWLECHFDRKRFVFQVRGKVSDENAARATAALLFVRDRLVHPSPQDRRADHSRSEVGKSGAQMRVRSGRRGIVLREVVQGWRGVLQVYARLEAAWS